MTNARWTPLENQHVTLKFLGWVPAEHLDEVVSVLEDAVGHHGPVRLGLDRFGAFPVNPYQRDLEPVVTESRHRQAASVDRHAPLLGVIQPHQQPQHGALPRPTPTDDRHSAPRTNHEIEIEANRRNPDWSEKNNNVVETEFWGAMATPNLMVESSVDDLAEDDFRRILTEPKHALTKQYAALLGTEDVQLDFRPDGIQRLAELAFDVNERTENIGARRLYTVMEKLLEEISFEGPDLEQKNQRIDARYVENMLSETVKDQDLSRYIL